jgi:hypothetical protein
MIVLYNGALTDDGPVRPDTYRSLYVLPCYCNYMEVRAFGWFTLYQILASVRGGIDYSYKQM